jgi:hypothetical protein
MVAAGASFDMDSPVEAQAEFDPPIAIPGAPIIYRLKISALDESLEVPDQIPGADALQLRAGGRAQNYVPTVGRKVRPDATVLFHGVAPSNGTYTIPGFQAMAYGKPIQVPPATLTVTNDGATGPQVPVLILVPPANDVYVGETFGLGVALLRAADNSVFGMSEPAIKGEFVFSGEQPGTVRQQNVPHDGQDVPAYISDVVVTPLREGPRQLIGQAYAIALRAIPGQPNASRAAIELVDTDPMTLTVHAVPEEGRLPGFTGAVGQFQLEPPQLSRSAVRAGEPFSLIITIRSPGPIGHVVPPSQPNVPGWQAFPPIPENEPASPLERDFESFSYTLIPLSNTFKLTPQIPFSYFDPVKKTYVDLSIPPQPIAIAPAAAGPAEPPLVLDPVPVETNDAVEKEPVLTGLTAVPGPSVNMLAPVQRRGWFYALQFIPALSLGGLWTWDRRRRFLREHPEVLRKRRARRGLRRQLRLARRAAAARDAAGFARAAAEALREACAPHGAAHPGALVCADVLQGLPEAERHGHAGGMVRHLFAAADALRFGGRANDDSALLSFQPDLEKLLEQLKMRL